jgi:predicted PurR-regulated permease PerM
MTDRSLLRSILLVSIFVLGAWLLYLVLRPFLGVIAWGVTIGMVTFPLYERLEKRMHRNIAAGILISTVFAVFALPVVFFSGVIAQEAMRTADKIHALGGVEAALTSPFPGSESLRPLLDRIDLHGQVIPKIQEMSGKLAGYAAEGLKGGAESAVSLFLMLLVLYVVYNNGKETKRLLADVLPFSERVTCEVFETVERVVIGVFCGVFLTCVVQGILGGIGWWIVGLPSPVLCGAGMVVASLIPVVGTALFWVPGALWLYFGAGDHGHALFLVGWGVLVMSLVADHLVKPYFISGRARISVVTTIFGGLGGLAAFGIFGIIAGPLLLALMQNLLSLYREQEKKLP